MQILKVFRPPPNPPIAEFIQPELKLAGLRIDAAQSSRARLGHSLGMSLLYYDVASTTDYISDLPEIALSGVAGDRVFNYIRWSPNGKRVAFTVRSMGSDRAPLELYVVDVPENGAEAAAKTAEFAARPVLGDLRLNSILHDFVWLDDDTIVASVIPSNRSVAPETPSVPVGPKISDNSTGKKSQARTYPDLIKACTFSYSLACTELFCCNCCFDCACFVHCLQVEGKRPCRLVCLCKQCCTTRQKLRADFCAVGTSSSKHNLYSGECTQNQGWFLKAVYNTDCNCCLLTPPQLPLTHACMQSKHDEELFEWHLTSDLLRVDVATGATFTLGPSRMYADVTPSPDDTLMIVSWIERPFSYELPVGRFPRIWQVWDRQAFQTMHALLSKFKQITSQIRGPYHTQNWLWPHYTFFVC